MQSLEGTETVALTARSAGVPSCCWSKQQSISLLVL